MGEYLGEMNNLNVGDQKVKTALRDLKDLHRNPLIHPEHSLDSVDDAIALMNGIHNVIVHMLREIPMPKPTVGAATAILTAPSHPQPRSGRARASTKKKS